MHVFVCGQAQPTFNLQYAFGDSTIAIGAATNITWTIETSEGGYYSPMSAEVIMPFIENAPALRLCRAEVTRVARRRTAEWGEQTRVCVMTTKTIRAASRCVEESLVYLLLDTLNPSFAPQSCGV